MHCVKSVQILSECGKCGPEKTPYLDTFHTVVTLHTDIKFIIESSQKGLSWSEPHLEPSRTRMMNQFCENCYRFTAVNCFRKKATSQMLDWILNTPLLILKYKTIRSFRKVQFRRLRKIWIESLEFLWLGRRRQQFVTK